MSMCILYIQWTVVVERQNRIVNRPVLWRDRGGSIEGGQCFEQFAVLETEQIQVEAANRHCLVVVPLELDCRSNLESVKAVLGAENVCRDSGWCGGEDQAQEHSGYDAGEPSDWY